MNYSDSGLFGFYAVAAATDMGKVCIHVSSQCKSHFLICDMVVNWAPCFTQIIVWLDKENVFFKITRNSPERLLHIGRFQSFFFTKTIRPFWTLQMGTQVMSQFMLDHSGVCRSLPILFQPLKS